MDRRFRLAALLLTLCALPAFATDATTTYLIATPSLTVPGANVKLQGSVQRSQPGYPTGTITFLYGSQSLGTATLVNAIATITVSAAVPPGIYSVVAKYSGDANDSPSTSAPTVVDVRNATSLTLTLNPYTVTHTENEVLTATLTTASGTAVPTGTVTFSTTGDESDVGLQNDKAILNVPIGDLPSGFYPVTATYAGDDNYASATATANLAIEALQDCGTTTCPAITLNGDAPQSSGFHGYADPSMRKDPNSPLIYLAYSWPHTVTSANTDAIDLHLSHSADGGATWNYDGPLFTSAVVTNPTSSGYAASNVSSYEVIDLLPVAIGSTTYWAQAHRQYLVADGTKGSLYPQAPVTSVIALSVIAVSDPGRNPSELLGLGSAPQTILGTSTTDSTIPINVNLATLNPAVADCEDYDQPTLTYENGRLYLAIECEDAHGSQPDHLEFPVFSTAPNGTDPRLWSWRYEGTIATKAEAVALGNEEGTPYQFLTEMEFVHSAGGQLLALMTPSVLTESGQQPVIQYGCRFVPVISLSPPTLALDPSGAPLSVASVTDSSLYVAPNEGPAACTYDPAASGGIVLVHKLEDDPHEGFYPTLTYTNVKP